MLEAQVIEVKLRAKTELVAAAELGHLKREEALTFVLAPTLCLLAAPPSEVK